MSAPDVVDQALIAAYRSTRYVACVAGADVLLQIDQTSAALVQLMAQHEASCGCFVTAWNPMGQLRSAADNRAANADLKRFVEGSGWIAFEGMGCGSSPDWAPEASFLVLGPDDHAATNLCVAYAQNAVVHFSRDGVPRLLWHPGVEMPK